MASFCGIDRHIIALILRDHSCLCAIAKNIDILIDGAGTGVLAYEQLGRRLASMLIAFGAYVGRPRKRCRLMRQSLKQYVR